jgi:HAMP domain-containing protein
MQPQSVFLAPVRKQTRDLALLGLVIAGVSIAAAILVAHLLSNPIRRLTQAAGAVTAGDLQAQEVDPAPVGGNRVRRVIVRHHVDDIWPLAPRSHGSTGGAQETQELPAIVVDHYWTLEPIMAFFGP